MSAPMTPERLAEIRADLARDREEEARYLRCPPEEVYPTDAEELADELMVERARLDWVIDQLMLPDDERADLTMSTAARLNCGISREDLLAEWRAAIDSARAREKGVGG